jgi:hypothetical protein
MKSNTAEDVGPDVLRSLSLRTRTDSELFALLGIMENQQRCFTAMAWRRLGKRAWHAIAPLKYRAGWLCAAVSGMLFISATSVAYNEYSINADVRDRFTALQLKVDESPAKIALVKTRQPLDHSCIPVHLDGGKYMLLPAPQFLSNNAQGRRDAIERIKQLATGCVATDIASSELQLQMSVP